MKKSLKKKWLGFAAARHEREELKHQQSLVFVELDQASQVFFTIFVNWFGNLNLTCISTIKLIFFPLNLITFLVEMPRIKIIDSSTGVGYKCNALMTLLVYAEMLTNGGHFLIFFVSGHG